MVDYVTNVLNTVNKTECSRLIAVFVEILNQMVSVTNTSPINSAQSVTRVLNCIFISSVILFYYNFLNSKYTRMDFNKIVVKYVINVRIHVYVMSYIIVSNN